MKRYVAVASDGTVRFSTTTLATDPPPEDNAELSFVPVASDFDATGMLWDGASFTKGLTAAGEETLRNTTRKIRAQLLDETEWTQAPDNKLTARQVDEWKAYRQALRDVPDQPGFPANVVWPSVPSALPASAKSFDNLKDDKWEEIKVARDAYIDVPLETEWGVFDHDAKSRQALLEAATGASVTSSSVVFTLANNAEVKLAPKQIAAVFALSYTRVQWARELASELRTRIYSAGSVSDLEAVQWHG